MWVRAVQRDSSTTNRPTPANRCCSCRECQGCYFPVCVKLFCCVCCVPALHLAAAMCKWSIPPVTPAMPDNWPGTSSPGPLPPTPRVGTWTGLANGLCRVARSPSSLTCQRWSILPGLSRTLVKRAGGLVWCHSSLLTELRGAQFVLFADVLCTCDLPHASALFCSSLRYCHPGRRS